MTAISYIPVKTLPENFKWSEKRITHFEMFVTVVKGTQISYLLPGFTWNGFPFRIHNPDFCFPDDDRMQEDYDLNWAENIFDDYLAFIQGS